MFALVFIPATVFSLFSVLNLYKHQTVLPVGHSFVPNLVQDSALRGESTLVKQNLHHDLNYHLIKRLYGETDKIQEL